jgi:hypothetical protein
MYNFEQFYFTQLRVSVTEEALELLRLRGAVHVSSKMSGRYQHQTE